MRKKTVFISICIVVLLTTSSSLWAQGNVRTTVKDDRIGTTETLRIYPTKVVESQWAGYENVLSPDLSEYALYQEFSERNAAYVVAQPVAFTNSVFEVENNISATTEAAESPAVEVSPELNESDGNAASTTTETEMVTTTSPAANTAPTSTTEVSLEEEERVTEEPVEVEVSKPVTDDGSGDVETAPEPEPEVSASTTVFKRASASVFAFFGTVTNIFPFTQSATTTEIETVTELGTSTDEVANEAVSTPEVEESAVDEVGVASSSGSTTVVEAQTPVATSSPAVRVTTTTPTTTLDIQTSDIPAATTTEVTHTEITRSITLGDFSTADLEKGQFVKNVQLRASFAGQYTQAEGGQVPTVSFVAQTPSTTFKIGTIVIDDEVSNALNGGHFLFSFPALKNLKQLKDTQVQVTFTGAIEAIEDVYLDALWLEVELETITKEDLLKRTAGDRIAHLKNPENYDFISVKKDFRRDEPVSFNLKYNSQRSKTVEAVREFFGRSKIKVEKVSVKHNGSSEIGLQAEVTTTRDGLVTIVLPDAERKKLKPGQYTVELTYTEGGKEFYDSFDFQWGLLSINTDSTEYLWRDMVTVYAGALTPGGNTLCAAELRLFVMAPNGAVTEQAIPATGACEGNNVTDIPDYMTSITADQTGEYQLYLERIDDYGNVISHTSSNFNVVLGAPVRIVRNGPTRIYPPAPYAMELTIEAEKGFSGTITERVPNTFKVTAAGAEVVDIDGYLELTWDVNFISGQNETVSYTFDAPDLSPFLYELGPATVEKEQGERIDPSVVNASSTDVASGVVFTEHRQWQIASDATGNMIVLWDDGASIPTDWSCLSCGSGTFYRNFAVGTSSANYGVTGGTANHTHTVSTSLLTSADTSTESGSGGPAIVTHTHTLTPTIGNGSNLPQHRQLRVIQYTASAGEPATLPAGAIGIFSVASSSLPTDWTRYAAQDGYYVYGEDTPGTTGGSNTHSNAITGTTGVASGGTARSRGGGTQTSGATSNHTHTISTNTESVDQQPPYLEVVFAKLGSAAAPPNDLITMWTEDVPSGWLDVSSDPSSDFHGRFIKGATSYGATGGSTSHTHADISGAQTSVPSATITGREGSAGAGATHQHNVNFTNFSTESNLPPYVGVVYGLRQGTDPVYEQLSYRWYANENNQTLTDPWPQGVSLDLNEREVISATSTPVAPGDEIRLRLNVALSNATSTIGTSFKLQYAAANVCSLAGSWFDVGAAASSTIWRGYDNGSVVSGSTLASTTLASTTVAQTYEENGFATSTPAEIAVDQVGEWDFVLQHNDAIAGTNYCFRMVENDGSPFSSYTQYPQLFTNKAPVSPTLQTPFDNEKTASSTPFFVFTTTDPEGEDLHYQVQIDNDFDFSSTVVDSNSITGSSQFISVTLPSDKAPFSSGDIMQFEPSSSLTNGVTYWWRVRAQDPDGSGEWGDWSSSQSFTVDTSLLATGWFQTTEEQFDTNTLDGVESLGTDEVQLITGSTTATMTSGAITFSEGTLGTAWNNLEFSDTNNVTYTIQYLNDAAEWNDVPDTALSGNSSGFSTSPVSLLSLDVETYDTLRVIATFDNGSGIPSLQDWAINWGYRVETPTITKLFANEKTGTTTPIFEFTTTDPQADDLTYQISWSTDQTFTASTTRTSTGAGFTNIDTGGDTDPFTSGETIQFEIAGADALTNGQTYWWRVRAKDTTGDDAYSFWTDAQSFTVDTSVTVSTWFQTTEEQFDSNILSGTVAAADDSVTVATVASESMLVYGQGTESEPRYRQWDGTEWSSESLLQSIGAPLKWAVVEAGVNREEYIAVTVGTDADVNAQVFTNGEWGNLQELTTNVGSVNARGFDIAYETVSGDAMVVYCNDGPDPSYDFWDGGSWSAGGTINVTSTDNCEWLELTSHPTTNEIIVIIRDAAGNAYETQVWNGSAWGNASTFGSPRNIAYGGIDVVYEASGGQAIAVAPSPGGGPNRMVYNVWNGTTWSGETTLTIGGRLYWADLAASPDSDNIVLCYQNDNDDVRAIRWTGSAWTGDTSFTTSVNAAADQAFSCVYEASTGRTDYVLGAYSDTTATNYRIWNTSSWSAESQVNSIVNSVTNSLVRTGDDTILGFFFDTTNDSLRFADWNGSAWGSTQTLENNMSVDATPFGKPYAAAARNPGSDGTTVVTPAIAFSDGVGPYWEEFSWNDTTPGTSAITYYVQYYDGDSWEFIPDGDLSGNGSGFSTGPVDLSGLSVSTYSIIRPYATLACDDSFNCPSINDWTVTWAEGITISGTLTEHDQTTNVNSGTVAVAVNGVLQTGKTGSVAAGVWSIGNVTVTAGDVVTVFVNGAAEANEAAGITRYDGSGDITGMALSERNLSLGSDDVGAEPLTNSAITQYTNTNDEDVIHDGSAAKVFVCADVGCADTTLIIATSTVYQPGGAVEFHDLVNNGTLTATSTLTVTGSWRNTATTTLTSSSVIFAATSSSETIDTTGAHVAAFNDVTFGTTTGNASWIPLNSLDVNGDLTIARGTLARGTTTITIAGDLTTSAAGAWSGVGTTTFDATSAATWSDASGAVNTGKVVIDGVGKIVTLGSDVSAQSIYIGGNDTLDASVSGYTLTVFDDFVNTNVFQARTGTVEMAATSSGVIITTDDDSFYNLSFIGSGGAYSFTEPALLVANDLSITAGTITLPTATTTISGSFLNTSGDFAHNNSAVIFDGSGTESITLNGGTFTNNLFNVSFTGSGQWTFTEDYATTSNDIVITSGTVIFPAVELAVGGSLENAAGNISAGTGTLRMYTSASDSLTLNGSALYTLSMQGSGSLTFVDASATISNDLITSAGTTVLPTTNLDLGGSFTNTASLTPNSGTVTFNSNDAGETVSLGGAALYDAVFNSVTGGWTLLSATTTNNLTLTAASDFTVTSGHTLAVGGVFTNSVGGASTTWTGTTLALTGGEYSINNKADAGDSYESIIISNATQVKSWNSDATTVTTAAGSAWYSQDNSAVDGALAIYGDYVRTSGSEYWSYATDFDGTTLLGSERIANVMLAGGATVDISDSYFEILGTASASTTISNQGSGTYTVSASRGTTSAQYYEFTDLGATGMSLLGAMIVPTLNNGSFTVATAAGSVLTIASSTIDANPSLQVFNTTFATTTAINAVNVTQTGGAPSSYWWFRNGNGNLYGEQFDADSGDPGSIRFDDSSLVITVAGTVYSDAGVTALTGGTCDGVTNSVRLVVEGGATYDTSCSAADGSYSIAGVVVIGDPTITIFLNDATGGEQATLVTKTPTASISDADLYANRVIVRHEDVSALTINDMAAYDNDDDADIQFTAATGTPNTLTTVSDTELFVWASSTFTPAGNVTLNANATGATYDGSLVLDSGATFTGAGTSTYTIGGSFTQGSGAQFIPASSTVIMTATTTGKTITAAVNESISFNALQFAGVGGVWNLNSNITASANIAIDAGSVTGTKDITLSNGSLSGNGLLSLGDGTVTLSTTNTLGGTQGWTFNNLTLGNGGVVGTTTTASAATTTISGVLTIANAHYFTAGNTVIDLTGTGTVFVETGTYVEGTSVVRYRGAGANVLATGYYDLSLDSEGGSQTYTATGIGISVANNLRIGGTAGSLFDVTTNDTVLGITGDVHILNNGTLSASDSASFTIEGSYTNDGSLQANGGTITFSGTGTETIAAGNSDFANVVVDAIGTYTISEHATATSAFVIGTTGNFTLAGGQTLAIGGMFINNLGGAATTWTGSTLSLYGGGDYVINPATTTDSYDTLVIGDSTQIRSWNSDASTVITNTNASLYSMDHSNMTGDLYIYGDYTPTTRFDHWSYATDFDGTPLGGGARAVAVHIENGSSIRYTNTSQLAVIGDAAASTTIQNQGAGTFSFRIGGTASTTFNYFDIADYDADGLTFSGSPNVVDLSNGSFTVANDSDSAITVGGTAITASPARTFTQNNFTALGGVSSAFNVTATGTSVSSWRFTNHTGNLDGEANDNDPDGDPGYIVWDDSAATITISGTVFSDEGVTTAGGAVCDDSTNAVRIVVAGVTTYNTTCGTGTGDYSISGISYSPGDSVIAFLTAATTEVGATVTVGPVSNINDFDIYRDRVIVRNEGLNAITIDDMATYDSSDDANIPFTAVSGSPDTLTLPADRKLIIWSGKKFTPSGNVTITNGGSEAYGGTFELYDGATFTAATGEEHSIGGSLLSGTGATFTAGNSTTTFTTSGIGRTISINDASFFNLAFSGSGSWTITDNVLSVNDFTQSAGSLTLPTGTTTVNGSFTATGGSFVENGDFVFTSTGAESLAFNGSDVGPLYFTGTGSWAMNDVNATSTGGLIIQGGAVTLPSGTLVLSDSFINSGGSFAHNNGTVSIESADSIIATANGSDFNTLVFDGGGSYAFTDASVAILGDLTLSSGTATFATATMSIGGSFTATGATFNHATGTILFNSTDAGETIAVGGSDFYNLVFASPTGGWTLTTSATTTNNFSLATSSSFTLQSGATLTVEGVFANSVGGAATTWSGSTLKLDGANTYEVNSKTAGGDDYDSLIIGNNSDISLWNSQATTTIVANDGSLYSQDHSGVDGSLYIFGDYYISTTTEYWNYATDFDGVSLSGSERAVTVSLAANATTTVTGGSLQMLGESGNETVVTNQGSGTYGLVAAGGTLNALHYQLRNLNSDGLTMINEPTISSLSYGDIEVAVNNGIAMTLSSTTLNANASLIITGNRFATTTAISANNVTLSGVTSNAWTFVSHTGNLAGEAFDIDGATQCGSVRWGDSSCLLTQQTNYRWRNDDGGIGVPSDQWYNASWDKRKRIRAVNADATSYTDAVVELQIPYDTDMQADFDDLRFTDASGTTSLSYFVASTTNGVAAEVWVKIPTLAASTDTTIYMYYANPVAASTASSTATFIAADDFEDASISEYSGDTTLFAIDAGSAFGGTYGLDNTANEEEQATDGMARFDQTVSQGETFRYQQYIDTSSGADEVCTLFGVQSPVTINQNYAVCLEQVAGTDYIGLSKDVVDIDSSGTSIASSTVVYTDGWYEVEVEWGTDDSFTVDLYTGGSLVTSLSGSDSSYTSGGYGFTYWYNKGGWDNISSRPTLTTEPTIYFGAEQTDGGATWASALNTPASSYNIGDIARLRIMVENSGLAVVGETYQLEYAPQGVAPSCESVSSANYNAVPVQASCGTSPICMQSASAVTNGANIADLLQAGTGEYTLGEAVENPSNTADALTLSQDTYTELEYVITPTVNVTDENICLRVTDSGSELDTYLRVAKLSIPFDPTFGAVTFNNGADISLLPGTTTRVYATATVTDLNGSADLKVASSTMYDAAVGAACTADTNSCYIETKDTKCSFTNCAGTSCTLSCYSDFYYHANPTDETGGDWYAFLEVEDTAGGYDFATSPAIDLLTLRALDVTNSIDYVAVAPQSDTGAANATTSIENLGNDAIDVLVAGTDLSDGYNSTIPVVQQKFATTTFNYSGCVSCATLSTSTTNFEVDLTKPTASIPPVTDDIYWGIAIPFGVSSAPHTGFNTFYATDD